MSKKVKIQVIYASAIGMAMTKEFEADTLAAAKKMVEENLMSWDKPQIIPSTKTIDEEEIEYDVSVFTIYKLSHIEIIDYTDGKEKIKEVKE